MIFGGAQVAEAQAEILATFSPEAVETLRALYAPPPSQEPQREVRLLYVALSAEAGQHGLIMSPRYPFRRFRGRSHLRSLMLRPAARSSFGGRSTAMRWGAGTYHRRRGCSLAPFVGEADRVMGSARVAQALEKAVEDLLDEKEKAKLWWTDFGASHSQVGPRGQRCGAKMTRWTALVVTDLD
jgi:hypothetical protein